MSAGKRKLIQFYWSRGNDTFDISRWVGEPEAAVEEVILEFIRQKRAAAA